MLSFDPQNPRSLEAAALYALADRWSECEGLQDLNDGLDATETRQKVLVARETSPWDAELGSITIEQLNDMLLEVNVRPIPANGHEAIDPRQIHDSEGNCPLQGGTFESLIRRQVREGEYEALGEDACYLAFLDCVSVAIEQLNTAAKAAGAPIINASRRVAGPLWNPVDSQSAQGRHLWAIIETDWGDRGGADE